MNRIMSTVILTKWGNSISLRIPSNIIKEAHLVAGEKLDIWTSVCVFLHVACPNSNTIVNAEIKSHPVSTVNR